MTVGIFASTPDPIVFGPDRLISSNPEMLSAFSSWRRRFLYLAPYQRSDYPDWHRSC